MTGPQYPQSPGGQPPAWNQGPSGSGYPPVSPGYPPVSSPAPGPSGYGPPAYNSPPQGPPPVAPFGTGGSPPQGPPPVAPLGGWGGPADAVPVQQGTARKRKGPRVVAAAIATICLVGSGVFAYASLSGADGPATPEAAVDQLFAALGNEDALGVLASLPPGERDTLRPLAQDMAEELTRLGVLDDSFELGGVGGVDLEFEDLTYEVNELADGIATVHVIGGTVRGRYELAELPLGETLTDLLWDGEVPQESDESTERISPDDEVSLVTVRRDGGWHVSLWYSIAEAAREDSGLPAPPFGNGVPAVGADSPEDAVQQMFAAMGDLDVRRLVELSPPEEMAALHDYAPLFLDEAEDAVRALKEDSDLQIRVAPLDLSTESADGRTIVRIGGLQGEVQAEGTEAEFRYQDGCVDLTVNGERNNYCADDVADMAGVGGEKFGDLARRFADYRLGIAVVQEGEKWYLSPTFTLGTAMLDQLGALERADLAELFDSQFNLFGSSSGGFGIEPALGGGVFGALDEEWDTSSDPTTTSVGPGYDADYADSDDDVYATDGYDRYYDACGDLEGDLSFAESEAEWRAAVAANRSCAAPFLASGDITTAELYTEVAYPECYSRFPYDPALTLAEQGDLFDEISACLSKYSD